MIPIQPDKITELHHEVIEKWAEFNKKTGISPFLLTLDHHTDILRPDDSVPRGAEFAAEAIKKLRHDEHIVWAYESGIISGALIVAQENFTPTPYPGTIDVYYDSQLWPGTQEILNSTPAAKNAAEKMFDDIFLSSVIPLIKHPYILDIDLDCILCEKALYPSNSAAINKIISESSQITISLERDWQRILRLNGETIDSENALKILMST